MTPREIEEALNTSVPDGKIAGTAMRDIDGATLCKVLEFYRYRDFYIYSAALIVAKWRYCQTVGIAELSDAELKAATEHCEAAVWLLNKRHPKI